jgi:hypothetical protein
MNTSESRRIAPRRAVDSRKHLEPGLFEEDLQPMHNFGLIFDDQYARRFGHLLTKS